MNDKIDVLAVVRRHAESHRALAESDAYSAQEAPRLEAAMTAIAELIEKSERFGLLFERWNRLDLEGVEPATESEVIEAMYAMRAAIARVGGAK